MSKLIDLTGQRFGSLTVIKKSKSRNRAVYWECKCDCGKTTTVRADGLRRGATKSCGCGHSLVDLTGQTFGRLKVLRFVGNTNDGAPLWECVCDCGSKTTVRGKYLKSGHTKSCGCFRTEQIKKVSRTLNLKHGLSYSRLYTIWNSMVNRCINPASQAYKHYGGRGIYVCDAWLGDNGCSIFSEWALTNGYSDNLTIDRIDVNGPYSPDNCRWVTMKVQANNTRTNRIIAYKGKTQTLMQWADELGIKDGTLRFRLKKGWPVEKAFTTPVKNTKFKKKEAE